MWMCGKREVEVAAIAAEPKDKVLPRAPVRSGRDHGRQPASFRTGYGNVNNSDRARSTKLGGAALS